MPLDSEAAICISLPLRYGFVSKVPRFDPSCKLRLSAPDPGQLRPTSQSAQPRKPKMHSRIDAVVRRGWFPQVGRDLLIEHGRALDRLCDCLPQPPAQQFVHTIEKLV